MRECSVLPFNAFLDWNIWDIVLNSTLREHALGNIRKCRQKASTAILRFFKFLWCRHLNFNILQHLSLHFVVSRAREWTNIFLFQNEVTFQKLLNLWWIEEFSSLLFRSHIFEYFLTWNFIMRLKML